MSRFDVAVLGLGPSGRALAHACARLGLRTVAIDPRPDRIWRATYSCWRDELPGWLATTAVRAVVDRPVLRTESRSIPIERRYAVLDNAVLHAALTLDAVVVHAGTVTSVDPIRGSTGYSVAHSSGRVVRADRVLDARGLARIDPGSAPPPLQTAFGIVVDAAAAAAVLDGAQAVLMDWRPAGDERPGEPPSFLYAIPLGDGRVLLEETSLVARPGFAIDRLRARLWRRLGALAPGLVPDTADVLDTESVAFPMVPAHRRPWRSELPTFGARGGLGHPATGYSVAASLTEADAVARALVSGLDPTTALWPRRARLSYLTIRRAASILEDVDQARMQAFFGAFFDLAIPRQRAFLSDRRHPQRLAGAMAATFVRVGPELRPALIRGVFGA